MRFEKLELPLLLPMTGQPLANHPQAIGPMRQRHAASLFQIVARMLAGKMFQTHQHAHGLDATGLRRRLGPLSRVRPDRRHLPQQGVGAAFHGRDFLLRNVLGRCAEPSRLGFGMNGNLLPTIVEHADQPGVPSHPQPMPNVFRRR